MNTVTREQVETLGVGDFVQFTFDTAFGEPLPGTRWNEPARVVGIFYRGDDVKGRAFACFYTELGPSAKVSGSMKEGDRRCRKVTR